MGQGGLEHARSAETMPCSPYCFPHVFLLCRSETTIGTQVRHLWQSKSGATISERPPADYFYRPAKFPVPLPSLFFFSAKTARNCEPHPPVDQLPAATTANIFTGTATRPLSPALSRFRRRRRRRPQSVAVCPRCSFCRLAFSALRRAPVS